MIELAINVRQRDADANGETHRNLRIPGKFFDEITITKKFDSVASTFKIGLLFDPFNEDHAELMCVTHIHECEIDYIYENTNKRQRMMTGFMLSQGFVNNSKSELSQVGGYSKAGMLQDCDLPPDCPLESNGLTFTQVVEKVINSLNSKRKAGHFQFKIKSARANEILIDIDPKSDSKDSSGVMALIAEIEGKAAATIPKTTAREAKNALSYLKDIAIQKRLILSHDALGNLVVGVPRTSGRPVLEIDNSKDGFGTVGVTDLRLVYDGTRMHSHITVIRQADKDGGNSAEYSGYPNPLVPIVYRPKVITLSSGDDITIEQAWRNELGNDLKGIVLKVTLDRWEINGKLLEENNIIEVCDPKLYLYEKSRWFIESIEYSKKPDSEGCVLTCVLPYVYNNEQAKNPFVAPGRNTPIA
jgi:prophage tail gpP-like protein